MDKNFLISVIVPAYNEEKLLPVFVKEVVLCLENGGYNYELLIIENGSTDKTLEIAREFVKNSPKVKMEHLDKAGYGGALISGIKKAKGDYLVVFNVDFWDKRFIEITKADLLGYDIIVGSKNLPGSNDRRPLSRRLVTKGFNLLLKIFFGFRGTDTHGIKTFRRSTVMPIVKKCRTQGGIFDSELLIRAQREGLKILELPVNIVEKRPNRFGVKRILETPGDLLNLYLVLKKKDFYEENRCFSHNTNE